MATDWIALLGEQAQLARRFAAEIPKAISRPDLTLDQASQIYDLVEKGEQDFDRIVEDMNRQDLDDAIYMAADRLQEIWSALSVEAANKVQAMRDAEPSEIRGSNEN
ncbi:hypothetical protein [Mesorhizobium sp. A556]